MVAPTICSHGHFLHQQRCVVLSGKMHVERQDTTRSTPASMAQCSTLSLIARLSLRNSTLYFMLAKRPPTLAARWITWLGLYLS